MNTAEYKAPDGRSFEELTDEERGEFDRIQSVYEGAPLDREALESITGGLTFRETPLDRWRLHAFAFFNGELDVMMKITTGVPLSEIKWRP